MRLVCLDTETTGLYPYGRMRDDGSPGDDQIIEYTLQVWNDGERAEAQTLRVWPVVRDAKRNPTGLIEVAPEVCKINGYDPATWGADRAFDWRDMSNLQLLDGALVLGHNVEFDLNFVRGEFLRHGVKPPRWNYRTLDMQKIAGPLVALGVISSAGLGDLCDYFGISKEGRHSSRGDVRMTLDVWERFLDSTLRGLGL